MLTQPTGLSLDQFVPVIMKAGSGGWPSGSGLTASKGDLRTVKGVTVVLTAVMSDTEEAEIVPDEWTGVYYDAGGGILVTIEFRDNGEVALNNIATESDEPVSIFDSQADFGGATSDFSEVPQHAIDDPVEVATHAYNKGYQNMMEHGGSVANALTYADKQIEILEKE